VRERILRGDDVRDLATHELAVGPSGCRMLAIPPADIVEAFRSHWLDRHPRSASTPLLFRPGDSWPSEILHNDGEVAPPAYRCALCLVVIGP
jgi:hypothetical protein